MIKFSRLLAAAAVATLTLAAAPAYSATGATTPATASAQIVKPLTLTAKQNLSFGTVILGTLTSATSVSMTSAGVLTCGSFLTCTGSTQPAIYNVTGSNNQVVKMYSAATNLTNANDSTTIVFTPALPTGAAVTLTNSGAPGTDFNVGGAIALPTTVTAGLYTGNINVTVDYN